VILLDTKGAVYNQQKAKELVKEENLILIAGHYEGVDHRVHEHVVDEVISIGEFVLTGGELPVMMVVDSVVRLLPGVLGNEESLTEESYDIPGKREYPQYTRPEDYNGWKVQRFFERSSRQNLRMEQKTTSS
jgi:tRNA (guanine37-N1)-methyltransferase